MDSPLTLSNVPRYDANPNTGEATDDTTMDPEVATNTIHQDAADPTAILFPVLETTSPRLRTALPNEDGAIVATFLNCQRCSDRHAGTHRQRACA